VRCSLLSAAPGGVITTSFSPTGFLPSANDALHSRIATRSSTCHSRGCTICRPLLRVFPVRPLPQEFLDDLLCDVRRLNTIDLCHLCCMHRCVNGDGQVANSPRSLKAWKILRKAWGHFQISIDIDCRRADECVGMELLTLSDSRPALDLSSSSVSHPHFGRRRPAVDTYQRSFFTSLFQQIFQKTHFCTESHILLDWAHLFSLGNLTTNRHPFG
jgi:hypothetical protein